MIEFCTEKKKFLEENLKELMKLELVELKNKEYKIMDNDNVKQQRCEFSIMSSGELKCVAEISDVHVCFDMPDKKCPIYRLRTQLDLKTEECEKKASELGNLGYRIKNQRHEINNRLKQLKEIQEDIEEYKTTNKKLLDDILKWAYKAGAAVGKNTRYRDVLNETKTKLEIILSRLDKYLNKELYYSVERIHYLISNTIKEQKCIEHQ